MFRYFALLWHDADPNASATAHRLIARCLDQSPVWQAVLSEPGMAVLCAAGTGPRTSRLLVGVEGRTLGVVLGDLFRISRDPTETSRTHTGRCNRLTTEEAERIANSRGRDLISSYWGNYVAILKDTETRTRWVLRSPAATLPCHHARIDAVDLYFSRTEDCAALDAITFSINWHRVAQFLIAPLSSSETSLHEIHEILPGFCDEHTGTLAKRHCYWDPTKVAQDDPLETFEQAAQTLHAVTRSCIHAWAEGTPHILQALSGGLDSSIVLGCLHDAPTRPEITCLTHFADGPDSDERSFARIAARRAECTLIERAQSDSIDLQGVLHGIRFENSPGMRIPEIDRIESDIARDHGACAISKGHGGDELFCRHHTHFYVADFLRDHGLRPALLALLMHSSVTEGDTVWTILASALRNAFVPRSWRMLDTFVQDQENQSLLHPDLNAVIRKNGSAQGSHLQSTRNCPVGKLWQIGLLGGRRFHELPSTRVDDPPQISPLLSQPIIETCLRIPTYLQMKNRRERAVARAAFTKEVPREIIDRRSKGGAEHVAWRLFRRNLPFIRETLLGGHLARARVLDRPRLEALLTGAPSSVIKATVPVFHLLGAEAWLAAWSGRGISGI